MKTLGYILIFLFFAVAAAYCEVSDRVKTARDRRRTMPALDVVAILEAIAAVESDNNPHAIGKLGERGRCQFMPTTWVRYTNAPFLSWASQDCEVTRRVEKAHLSWICGQLLTRGHQLEPALIAAAWRFGVGNAARNIRDGAAQRVANLYAASTKEAR